MMIVNAGATLLLRMPDGTMVPGHISASLDFIADTDPDTAFTD